MHITILIRFSYSFLYQLSLPVYLSGLIFLTYYFFLFIHYSYTFHLSPSYTSYHKCCHFFCLMFILFHLHDYLLIHLDYPILFFFVCFVFHLKNVIVSENVQIHRILFVYYCMRNRTRHKL